MAVLAHYFEVFFLLRVVFCHLEKVCEAIDGIERCTQFVGHISHEERLLPYAVACFLSLLT